MFLFDSCGRCGRELDSIGRMISMVLDEDVCTVCLQEIEFAIDMTLDAKSLDRVLLFLYEEKLRLWANAREAALKNLRDNA